MRKRITRDPERAADRRFKRGLDAAIWRSILKPARAPAHGHVAAPASHCECGAPWDAKHGGYRCATKSHTDGADCPLCGGYCNFALY